MNSKDQTIASIKAQKQELETEIQKMLNTFTLETGLEVDVELNKVYSLAPGGHYVEYFIKLKGEL